MVSGEDFHTIGGQEVVDHVCTRSFVAVVENIVFGVHVPLDGVHFVSSMRSVFGHHNGSFKLSVDKILVISLKPILD